jgi:hypothetical protein
MSKLYDSYDNLEVSVNTGAILQSAFHPSLIVLRSKCCLTAIFFGFYRLLPEKTGSQPPLR